MERLIAHCLILLVLFTHSTMAMDVHLPHAVDSSVADHHSGNDHNSDVAVSEAQTTDHVDTLQGGCADAGGHCSHHQAHSAGLLAVNTLVDIKSQPVLLPVIKNGELLHYQMPPVRPPKA